MALPEITLPPEVPTFVVDSQQVAPKSPYADVDRSAGHKRKRRVRTASPRIVDVATTKLTQAQMAALDIWFEDVLLAGERAFAVELSNEGPGTLWWSAQWVAPYKATPSNGRWVVTGQLHLTGQGSAVGPVPSGLAVEYGIELVGSAEIEADTRLAVEYGIELLPDPALKVEYGVELVAIVPYYLLIGGGHRLLIGGGKRLRIA